MARSYTAEEVAEILVKDYDDGEMDSGNSLDEASSSDIEATLVSQICRDSDNSFDTSLIPSIDATSKNRVSISSFDK